MSRNLLLLLPALMLTGVLHAQSMCGPIAERCEQHITDAYIPDGQFYRALLQGDEVAEFGITLQGGTTYRVAACSGDSDGILVFTVRDREGNELFSNREHGNAPYWDLVVAHTIEANLEANLDPSKTGSGCAVMLIGFKR